MIRHLFAALAVLPLAAPPAIADTADQAQRWSFLREAVFANRPIADGAALITLQAPARAEDAALVPIAIAARPGAALKGLYLVIDNNPAPLAAHFTFGPASASPDLHLRVRVDQYTLIHAVAEAADGRLYAVAAFVKASGGCSAAAGGAEQPVSEYGRMKLRQLAPATAQLLVRHPNFNGMQMDQVTRYYTPARYIDTIDVTYNGASVFHLDSDISLSSDPAITFGFVPQDKGAIKVVAHDTRNAVYTQSFDLPAGAS